MAHAVGLEAQDEVHVVGPGRLALPHQPRAEAAADDATDERGELAVVLGGDFADNHAMIPAARSKV